jgi:hypothetical protein
MSSATKVRRSPVIVLAGLLICLTLCSPLQPRREDKAGQQDVVGRSLDLLHHQQEGEP